MLNFRHFSPDKEEPIVGDNVEVKEIPDMIEDGDETLINLGGEAEAPESDPVKGQSVEEKAEPETKTEYEIPDTYKGKELPDIIKMHQELQHKLGEQGNEMGQLKKQLEKANLSPEELRESLKSQEVKLLYDKESDKLADMDVDEVSREELRAQRRLVEELRDEYTTKQSKEAIREIVQSGENKVFKASQKEVLKKDYELSADEIANLESVAENNFLENGKLTERSYHHALVSLYGLPRVMKSAEMKAEAKARADISKAVEKQGVTVDTAGATKGGNYTSLTDLINNPAKLEAHIEALYAAGKSEQVDAIQNKIKARMR